MNKENGFEATDVQKNFLKQTDPIIHNLTRNFTKARNLFDKKKEKNDTIPLAWIEAFEEVGNETLQLLDKCQAVIKDIGDEDKDDVFDYAIITLDPSDILLSFRFKCMRITDPKKFCDIRNKSKKLLSILKRMDENGILEGLGNMRDNSNLSE